MLDASRRCKSSLPNEPEMFPDEREHGRDAVKMFPALAEEVPAVREMFP